jgi:hypothetical protein
MRINRRLVSVSLGFFCFLLSAPAHAQNSCAVSEEKFHAMYRVLDTYPESGKKGLPIVEKWLRENEKAASGCEDFHYLAAEAFASKRDWAQMEAAFLRGIALSPNTSHGNFANILDRSMQRAAAPRGDRNKLTRLDAPVSADSKKSFAAVTRAALEKWKDDPDILTLRQRIPES